MLNFIDPAKGTEGHNDSLLHGRLLGAISFLTDNGGLRKLRKEKNGFLRGKYIYGTYFQRRIATKSGKLDFAHDRIIHAIECLDREPSSCNNGVSLISRRQRDTHNSWTQLVTSARSTQNFCYMNAATAAKFRVTFGKPVNVSSNVDSVELIAAEDEDLMDGVIAVNHGWGQAVSREQQSQKIVVNINRLLKDGLGAIEPLYGMSHMNGVPVTLLPVDQTCSSNTADSLVSEL